MNRELDQLISSVRPPRPEMPTAERLARERQGIFHSHQPGEAQRGPANPYRQHQPVSDDLDGPMERSDVCILDERGGHQRQGMRCPHFADFDRHEVIEVNY